MRKIPPYIASGFDFFQYMENWISLKFLLIRLWIIFGDSLHRWIRLREQV
jgi:hypothetical protein